MKQWQNNFIAVVFGTSPRGKVGPTACLSLVLMALTTMSGASAQSLVYPHLAASSVAETKSAEEIEYDVKAAFIYNFMRFIDWAEEKLKANRQYQQDHFPSSDGKTPPPPPMIIGIVGKNPFRQAFAPILDKKINERSIELVSIEGFELYLKAGRNDADALAAYGKKNTVLLNRCDVLFISGSEGGYLDKLMPLIARNFAITISDIPDFVLRGGMIGFVNDKNKVRFDIHLDNVEKEKIKIRSQLLELARQVHKKSDTKR
jgi:hypothetical protein